MCVHYNKSSELIKARKAIKIALQEKIRKNQIDDFAFLLSVERDILGYVEEYGDAVKDVLDGFYEEAAKSIEDGVLTGWEAKIVSDKVQKLIDKMIIEASYYAHVRYSMEYDSETKSKSDWMIIIAPFVLARTFNIVDQIIKNTVSDISRMLDAFPYNEAPKYLRDKDNLPRALTIASTELRVAQSYGEFWTMEQVAATKVVNKYWVGVLDDRIRDSHFEASQFYNQNNAIPFNSYFQIGESLMKYPRDTSGSAKEIVNCRCYLGYSVT